MRTLNDHKVNGLNEALIIEVLDGPGDGNASHEYVVSLCPGLKEGVMQPTRSWPISFQKGPIQEAGHNGISNEALLTIVIDRMRGFQSGQFACRENAIALTHLEDALMWLQKRTRDRLARGVEGTHTK